MKSVVPKKAAALLLVRRRPGTFIFETVQTVRANAEAQLMEEWGLETALTSSDAEAEPRKVICLTFDDGPSYLTPKVLEILKQYGVRATFLSPASIRNMHTVLKRRGMQGIQWECIRILMIMRRSMLPAEAYYADLEKISMLCVEQIGYIPRYIRFPGGSSNSTSVKYSPGLMTFLTQDVTERGYLYYDWNCSSGDGRGKSKTAGSGGKFEKMRERIRWSCCAMTEAGKKLRWRLCLRS